MDGKNAQLFRDEIEMILKDGESSDYLIPYEMIALAFPSSTPHPETFEHNCIDVSSLKAWAKKHGWYVSVSAENKDYRNTLSPPISFQKIVVA